MAAERRICRVYCITRTHTLPWRATTSKQTLHGIGGDTHLGACFDAATDCDHPGSARPMEVLPRRPVPALPSSFSCTLTVGSETKSSPVRERGRERRRKRRHVSAMRHDCFGCVLLMLRDTQSTAANKRGITCDRYGWERDKRCCDVCSATRVQLCSSHKRLKRHCCKST